MLDHLSIAVSDVGRSTTFYDAVLAPLGYNRVWSTSDSAGYGYAGDDENFAIKQAADEAVVGNARSHIAFNAPDRIAVVSFHAAALQHGGVDEGGPSLHPEYGKGYFAAFVRDPDGYRLEAVLHEGSN